jgi:hypothetical protein
MHLLLEIINYTKMHGEYKGKFLTACFKDPTTRLCKSEAVWCHSNDLSEITQTNKINKFFSGESQLQISNF